MSGGSLKGTGASDGYSVGHSGGALHGVSIGSSGDRPKGTGASYSYSVGHSEGALVPVGSSGHRPEGTSASRLFWRALHGDL